MLEKILNLDGVVLLNKKQQQAVNGGEKCRSTPLVHDGIENSINSSKCLYQCRPSFLGIGFGSWDAGTEIEC